MTDVVRSILDYNAGRDPDRFALKLRKMRADPFSFLRGTCHLFYDRLHTKGIFRHAPLTWVCGDLHLQNYGSYKGDNALVYFDINDFDEAALAPCTWDLVRFLTSLHVALQTVRADNAIARALGEGFVDTYAHALAQGKARWVERQTATGIVRQLLDGLQFRTRPAYLASRTQLRGAKRVLRSDGKKALPASQAQCERVVSFMKAFARKQPNPRFFRVLDVARRIAGTGSLGVDRYAILVEGKGSPDHNVLLDLKLALPSSLVLHLKTRQPRWTSEAERVVAVMRRMQAVSMAFLQAVEMGGKPYVLRALQPSEDRIALPETRRGLRSFGEAVGVMAEDLAWDELRSSGQAGSAIADELIAFGREGSWKKPLLAAARDCTERVMKDWRIYAKAFDDGRFQSQLAKGRPSRAR